MRRSLLIWILLFSLLAGCAPASAQEQPAPLTEAGVLDAYTQAAQVYDWFDLYSPSTGIEAIQTEAGIFYPVEEPGLENHGGSGSPGPGLLRAVPCGAAALIRQLPGPQRAALLSGRRPGKQSVSAVQKPFTLLR